MLQFQYSAVRYADLRSAKCSSALLFSESIMDEDQLRHLLEAVRSGASSVDAALERMRHLPFEDLGFAKLDHHRALRHGITEVIFGKGKTPEQIEGIATRLLEKSQNLLITRANRET